LKDLNSPKNQAIISDIKRNAFHIFVKKCELAACKTKVRRLNGRIDACKNGIEFISAQTPSSPELKEEYKQTLSILSNVLVKEQEKNGILRQTLNNYKDEYIGLCSQLLISEETAISMYERAELIYAENKALTEDYALQEKIFKDAFKGQFKLTLDSMIGVPTDPAEYQSNFPSLSEAMGMRR
jgi:hypothetical protein